MKVPVIFSSFLATVLLLGGCGNTSSNEGEEPSDNQNDATASGETRAFTAPNGEEINIPENPERIVTDFYAGEFLAVGANVVGAGSWSFSNPFIEEELKNIKDVGDPIHTEEVLALEPDLIVVMDEEQYEKLSQIAPTVVIPYNTAKNVEESLQLFGELANAEAEAAQFLDSFNEEAEAARARVQEVVEDDATFGIYELTDKGDFWVFNDNAGRGGQVIYNALGLKALKAIDEEVIKTGEMKQLSTEVIPDYAADYMFITDYHPEGDSKLAEMESSPIWQGLEAVKNNRVFINDFDTFYPYDPISVRGQIDLIADMIVERAENNGQ
ncbi:iron-hydroxamate ABC transporter substrate-binding protein [Shouchella clausii]|uniref:iron-hydroxamate ABC transporter substrate-binding protein n=1 Tax=Shouchella clausii TaxID=79880 RepID=UPI00280C0FC7|nr:iron-hydroxamate ABC transporter substrate-binding protein [Shouchella clausii]WMM34211.1 iron-hydroxamate ABC transporter substrate-binding protein [Shouchella clausii]